MQIMALGLDLHGSALFEPTRESDVVDQLMARLGLNAPALGRLTDATTEGSTFRSEAKRGIRDPGDPRTAGWTYLINQDDPLRADLGDILQPLAQHRGMANPTQPLLFGGEPEDEWLDWLHDRYFALELAGKAPQYVMIVGSPTSVPFRFQSLLDTVANVGRVAFDSPDQLETYVEKVLRLEALPEPQVDRTALFFAPDAGLPDPTYFSREYMAAPLADHVEQDLGFKTVRLLRDDATKPNLERELARSQPALVYTASHGLGATSETPDVQRRLNGAICCQTTGPLWLDSLFTADDVPMDQPFLEGAVFFQFACFGYGTPATSDYSHWVDGVPETFVDADFVAALPKALLAHPAGPIAYVGHVDTAFLHAFTDAAEPHILDRWHTRISPFKSAIDALLGVRPAGLAMQSLNERYSTCNAVITDTYDREASGGYDWTPERRVRFLDIWITRGDAQNYMVLGDPAAALRIPI